MSTLSPGSRATTNVFMILGIVVLLALVWAGNRDDEQPGCAERLVRAGEVVWDPEGPIIHPGDTRTVTLNFALLGDGTVADIEVISAPSPYDEVAVRALRKSVYAELSNSSDPLRCSYSYNLRID